MNIRRLVLFKLFLLTLLAGDITMPMPVPWSSPNYCIPSCSLYFGMLQSGSVAIKPNGVPVFATIGYSGAEGLNGDNPVYVINCDTIACQSPTITSVVPSPVDAFYVTLRLGSDGFPRLAWSGPPGGVYFVKCTNANCSSSTNHAISGTNSDDFPFTFVLDGTDIPTVIASGFSSGVAAKIYRAVDASFSSTSSTNTLIESNGINPQSALIAPNGHMFVSGGQAAGKQEIFDCTDTTGASCTEYTFGPNDSAYAASQLLWNTSTGTPFISWVGHISKKVFGYLCGATCATGTVQTIYAGGSNTDHGLLGIQAALDVNNNPSGFWMSNGIGGRFICTQQDASVCTTQTIINAIQYQAGYAISPSGPVGIFADGTTTLHYFFMPGNATMRQGALRGNATLR